MLTFGFNKQRDLFIVIIEKNKKTGGKREPGMPVSAWTLTSQPLPHLPCQRSEANASSPPKWTLITVYPGLWDPQMKALIKGKSVTTLRMAIGSHLALETDQVETLNHGIKVGQISHLL